MATEESARIEITALGRIAALGAVYDARTEEFTGQSVLQEEIPDEDLTTTIINSSNLEIAVTDSYSEKFEKLNLSGGLKVSVLLGLISLEGSGSYLKQSKNSARSVSGALIYTENTVEKQINTNHKDFHKYLITDRECLDPNSGTHFVMGIRWGRNLVVNIEQSNVDSSKIQEASGNLKATLTNATTWKVDAKGAGSNLDNSSSQSQNYTIKIHGDLIQDGEKMNLQNAIQKLRKRSETLKDCQYSNADMGNALKYIVVPLSRLPNWKALGINAAISTIQRVDGASVRAIIYLFDDISLKRQILNDYQSDVEKHAYCLTQEQREQVSEFMQEFENAANIFAQKLRPALKAVREGKEETTILNEICSEYKAGKFSASKIKAALSNIKGRIDIKMAWAQMLRDLGGRFIPPFEDFKATVIRTRCDSITVLYIREDWITNPEFKESWENMVDAFEKGIELCKGSVDHRFLIVDCDVHDDLSCTDLPSIDHYKNGRLVFKCGEKTDENKFFELLKPYLKSDTCPDPTPESSPEPEDDGSSIALLENCDNLQYEGKPDNIYILHIRGDASEKEKRDALLSYRALKESRTWAKREGLFIRCNMDHLTADDGLMEAVEIHLRHKGELLTKNIDKVLEAIPIVGTYNLTDNGDYDAFLKGVGLTGFANWVIRSWISWTPTTSTVETFEGNYTIGEGTGGVWYRNEFRLNQEVLKTTPDGVPMKSKVTRALNCLREEQNLFKEGKIRVITRVFTEDELIIHFQQEGVPNATRVFKRGK